MEFSERHIAAPPEPPMRRWKVWSLAIFFLIFLFFLYRLFDLQVLSAKNYRQRLERQAYRTVPIPAARGNIYDRHHQLLARTVLRLTVAVDPKLLKKPQQVAQLLHRFTSLPADSFRTQIAQAAHRRYVVLARNLPLSADTLFAALRDPGVIRIKTPVRFYPFGPLAVQTLGFVDAQGKGQTGIEQQYDSLLRGTDGYQTYLRDALGRMIPDPAGPSKSPQNGHSLRLTLDYRIQQIVEQELIAGIQKAAAAAGTAIAMDPATGEILAMASYPHFNPNNLRTFSPAGAKNRAIADIYEPGSTFKGITAAALLEEGKITPSDSVDGHNGKLRIEDHVVRDAHPLGKTDFRTALIHSSNVIFAELSRRLSAEQFYRYARDFGFGLPTGIDLPGEARGILKKPGEFDAATQMFMAFGYGLAATALQILNAYAAIANGGTLLQPMVVRAILDEDGEPLHTFAPKEIRRVISKETADTLAHLLELVVEQGTGRSARIAGIRIAGKTGTAQQLINGRYSRQDYTSSFVGFFPVDTPRIAIIVMLNKPRRGYYASQVAAPIFRKIARKLIPLLLRSPVPTSTFAADTTRFRLPPLYGLTAQQVELTAQLYGLRYQPLGATDGVVIWQSPLPGNFVQRGDLLRLRFSADVPPDSLSTVLRRLRWKHLPLRQALTLVQLTDAIPVIHGSGQVRRIHWIRRNDSLFCHLYASP